LAWASSFLATCFTSLPFPFHLKRVTFRFFGGHCEVTQWSFNGSTISGVAVTAAVLPIFATLVALMVIYNPNTILIAAVRFFSGTSSHNAGYCLWTCRNRYVVASSCTDWLFSKLGA